MYSPAVIAAREEGLYLKFPYLRGMYPSGIPTYSVPDSAALTTQISLLHTEEGGMSRPFTEEESRFVTISRLRFQFDFPYVAERWIWIDQEGHGLRPLYPLWESQLVMLAQMGRIEEDRWRSGHPDGILLNVLKARQLGMCLDPTTRVLTADLRWIPLSAVTIGQELVATEEMPRGGRGAGRKMQTARVEAIRVVQEPAFKLTLSNGVVLIATGAHRFLTRNRGGVDTRWRAVKKMIVGEALRVVTQPWDAPTVEDGWFGGLLDGEGSLRPKARAGVELCVSQVAGPVYDRARAYAHARGYIFREEVDRRTPDNSKKFGRGPVGKIVFTRMGDLFPLVGQTRPTRFLPRRWWEDKEFPGKRVGGCWASVLAIEPLGVRPMIDLQTSTKTFLAEGVVSHNSTLSEALVAHRVLARTHTRALVGADVEDQAGYLFRMVGRIYDQLPWFLRPARQNFVKNREMVFGNESYLKTAWGKSTRGAAASVAGEGTKGALGRGQTFSVVHISELATWDNPDQLDSALFPAIPVHPDTLVILESTAEFAGDWWHQQWETAAQGLGRFTNIFIPWCAEPKKYSLPAPDGWIPSPATQEHAQKCERIAPGYLGKPLTLSNDQLYWYESTRATYAKKGRLPAFLKEYPADDQECFQYAGSAIFTFEQLEAIDQAGSRRPILDIWAVDPAREIAKLRRETPDSPDPRPPAPLAPRQPGAWGKAAADLYPIPPGYGFQRLPPERLRDHPNLRGGLLVIWEYPRARGPRRYVLGVDVGDGLGQDYTVIDVIREPTIEAPAEQVAQWVSNTHGFAAVAGICDAIGRLYTDPDGVEALAAIETNNHGIAVQETLQLHLGYSHFYRWEYADAADPQSRYSTRIGWQTTTRTRPLLLAAWHSAITEIDPLNGLPEFILNSPVTRGELRHFVTATTLGEAEAARKQHDDAIFASAIGYYVAWKLAGGEIEPVADRRRRKLLAEFERSQQSGRGGADWRNTATTAAEIDPGSGESYARPTDPDDDLDHPSGAISFFDGGDARSRIDF